MTTCAKVGDKPSASVKISIDFIVLSICCINILYVHNVNNFAHFELNNGYKVSRGNFWYKMKQANVKQSSCAYCQFYNND